MIKKTAVIKKVSAKELEKAVFGNPKEFPRLKKATVKSKNEFKKIEFKIKTLNKSMKQKEIMLKKATVAASKKKSPATIKAKKTAKLTLDKFKKELKLVQKLLVEANKKWKLSVAQEELFAKREVSRQWAVMSFVKKWEKEFVAKSRPKKKTFEKSATAKPSSIKRVVPKAKPTGTVVPMVSNTPSVQPADSGERKSYSSPISNWVDNLKRT